jgi:hypothetical protein
VRNLLYWIFTPLTELRNRRDLFAMERMAAHYQDVVLTSDQSRQNAVKRVFDALERGLSDDEILLQPSDEGRRTFFDNCPKEEAKEEAKGEPKSEQIDTSKHPEIQP